MLFATRSLICGRMSSSRARAPWRRNTAAAAGSSSCRSGSLCGSTTWTRADSTPSISLNVCDSSWLSA